MKNIEKGLILVKALFSLFISYLVIFNGGAGSLVNAIGHFIVAGNYILGFIYTITIFAICPLLLYNLTFTSVSLCSLKNKLLTFDITLILISSISSIFVSTKVYHMPLADAQSQYGLLTVGTAILFILSTIVILTILKKLNTEVLQSKELICNKNPLNFTGKITRLPYFVTKLVLVVISLIPIVYKNINNQFSEVNFMFLQFTTLQIVFVLAFYAASKRLRDVQWSQWLLLLWVIPFVGFLIGLPLLVVKSKNSKSMDEKEILKDYRMSRVAAFRTIKDCSELLLKGTQNAELYYKRAMATIFVGDYYGGYDKMYGLMYLDSNKVKSILDDFKLARTLNPTCLDYIKEETLFLFEYTYSENYEAIYDVRYKDVICDNCRIILEQEPHNEKFKSILNIMLTAERL